MEEELRNRHENTLQNSVDENAETGEDHGNDITDGSKTDVLPPKYDVEKDPDYMWIFVGFRIVIVVLAYISFQICFDTFIRPLFISVDERIGMIIASLQEQWCSEDACTPEEQRTIQAIVKNIKDSGKRFW